jgi:hypothetical protein
VPGPALPYDRTYHLPGRFDKIRSVVVALLAPFDAIFVAGVAQAQKLRGRGRLAAIRISRPARPPRVARRASRVPTVEQPFARACSPGYDALLRQC